MNCIIVDDNKIELAAVKQLISLDSTLNLIGECTDAADAFKKILDHPIDLIFLDIEMPEMSGIDLVKSLKGKMPIIIFMTSGPEYAAQAFDLNVVDFITKPIVPTRFLQAVTKAKELVKGKGFSLEPKNDEFIFIRDSNVIKRVKLDDILYLEAKGDNVRICLSTREYSIHSTMKAVEQKLNPRNFFRVHRSFIVNVSKIDTVDAGMLIIEKYMIPISDAYRAALNKRIQVL